MSRLTNNISRCLALLVFCLSLPGAQAAYNNEDEAAYLANWDLLKQSYTVPLPDVLRTACVNKGNVDLSSTSTDVAINAADGASITSDQLQTRCSASQRCIIGAGVTVRQTGNLNVGAIINKVRRLM